jgi:hypothetical protein
MTDWESGDRDNVLIRVESRPSLLYNQLFGASLSGIITSALRIAIFLLCLIFAIIELLALWMAIRLSRTITASVADLYSATQHIDRGDLNYRIGVTRSAQLAEVSRPIKPMLDPPKLFVEQKRSGAELRSPSRRGQAISPQAPPGSESLESAESAGHWLGQRRIAMPSCLPRSAHRLQRKKLERHHHGYRQQEFRRATDGKAARRAPRLPVCQRGVDLRRIQCRRAYREQGRVWPGLR